MKKILLFFILFVFSLPGHADSTRRALLIGGALYFTSGYEYSMREFYQNVKEPPNVYQADYERFSYHYGAKGLILGFNLSPDFTRRRFMEQSWKLGYFFNWLEYVQGTTYPYQDSFGDYNITIYEHYEGKDIAYAAYGLRKHYRAGNWLAFHFGIEVSLAQSLFPRAINYSDEEETGKWRDVSIDKRFFDVNLTSKTGVRARHSSDINVTIPFGFSITGDDALIQFENQVGYGYSYRWGGRSRFRWLVMPAVTVQFNL